MPKTPLPDSANAQQTIAEMMQARFETLTRAERQLTNSLLDNYPVSGLASITAIAQSAQVSTPTVVRMVQKLGFGGFAEFQARLRDELEARISNPISKHDLWASDAPDTHMLNRFADAVMQNLRQTLGQIDPADFDAICTALADRQQKVYVTGGRITRSIAEYLFTHLQMLRGGVTFLSAGDSTWPHHLLDLAQGDIFVMFDMRRYENALVRSAELAAARGATIVLFTDQWGSPATKHARYRINCRIEAPSAWDSAAAMLVIVESLIAQVQQLTWDGSRARMDTLEELFDTTGLFRKFK